MNIATIILATTTGISSLLYALYWQTPTVQALALLICGGLLTASIGWHFRPQQDMNQRWKHRSSDRQGRP